MKAIQAIGQEDQEDRVQRQALEAQLMQMKSNAAVPEAIRAVEEKKLEQLHNDAQPEKGGTAALERLRGSKDSFAPADETLNTDDDKRADYSIEALKRSIESMERRVQDTLDPEEARELTEELQGAKARLRQKGSDAYRRLHARYAAVFGGVPERRAALHSSG